MKMKYLFPVLLLFILSAVSCSKDPYDAKKQLETDEALIKDFIAKNNIDATRDENGIYYQIINPGEGNITYTANTSISARYTGRLLNGNVFDQTTSNPLSFPLGGVIPGWQIGISKIQKGGKIRLLIPSVYAYGNQSAGSIPKNSVLDFDVELVDASN